MVHLYHLHSTHTHTHIPPPPPKMSTQKTCIAIRLAAAIDYGHSDWKTGTVAYQCEKNATKGKFCGICSKHKGSFGKIGFSYTWDDGTESTVPEYAIKDGTMEDGTKVGKGDALCCIFANPLMDEEGNILVEKQDLLDDEYWQCDGDDEEDEDDDEDDDEGEEDDDEGEEDDDSSSSDDYKGIKVADLRSDLEDRGLSTKGKKAALVARLVDNDNGEEEEAPKKDKKDKKEKKKRPPSMYNLFMQREIPKYKKKHDCEHSVAFSECAKMWTAQKDD